MGEGSFPKVGYLHHHLLLPGHRAPPVPFSPGIPLGQTQGPSLPGLGLSEKKAQCFPSTQALSFPSPGPRNARASALGCMCEVYPHLPPSPGVCQTPTSLPKVRDSHPGLSSLGLRGSVRGLEPFLLLCLPGPGSVSLHCCVCLPSPQFGHAPGHGGAPAQHPALQQLLRVQRGPDAPHAVCRLPGWEGRCLPGAWVGGACGEQGAQGVGSALRAEERRGKPGRILEAGRPGMEGALSLREVWRLCTRKD